MIFIFLIWLFDFSETGDCAELRVKGGYEYEGGLTDSEQLQDKNSKILW